MPLSRTGFQTAGTIINRAAVQCGLASVTDPYASTDQNFSMFTEFLSTVGMELVNHYDWTQLITETLLITRQQWKASTVYTASAAAWLQNTVYATNAYVSNNGNLYQATTGGTSSAHGPGPQATSTSIVDGTVTWAFLNTGSANIVYNGQYFYTCSTGGTSGSVGPTRVSAGTETEPDVGTIQWTFGDFAGAYPLPSDWARMNDGSQWDRSMRLPLLGPLTGGEVQYLKARLSGVLIRTAFRIQGNQLFLLTIPSAGKLLAYEYLSNNWCWSNAGSAPDKAAPTASNDTVLFGPELIVSALRLKWMDARGFDTTTAMRTYKDNLEAEIIKNVGGRMLNLGGNQINTEHLIDASNLPITGFDQ